MLVLDRYRHALLDVVTRTLHDGSRDLLDRIAGYFSAIEDVVAPIEWRCGCMVANLGLELPSQRTGARALSPLSAN